LYVAIIPTDLLTARVSVVHSIPLDERSTARRRLHCEQAHQRVKRRRGALSSCRSARDDAIRGAAHRERCSSTSSEESHDINTTTERAPAELRRRR
jgi:hypothetical protein